MASDDIQEAKGRQKAKTGPEPERVKIEGMDWQDAVAKALRKPMPVKPKTARKKRK